MSSLLLYAGHGLLRKNLICALSYFPRPRDCVAIKDVEAGRKSFPHWKRRIKGDFFDYLQPSTIDISPGPSFPKRGNPNPHQQSTGKSKSVRILGLALLILFFPARPNAQEPLRAGTIFSATQAPLWAAKEGRFFEKYGIKNLEVIQFSGGQPVTRALIGGDIQISTTGGAAVVNARLKGADTVIIARTVGVFPYTLYVSKDIHNAAELKRKKLAVSTVGGSGYVAMQYALKKLGLDPDKDVALLQVGDFGTRLASLASGTVHGTLLLPPFTLRARELGLRPLYDLVGSGIQYPINQITTRQSFIKSQRETVKNFLKGLVAGLARFRTDREFGVKVLGQNLRETDTKILQETYEFWLKVFPKIPNPGPEDATVFLEFMQVKEQRDWKDFVDTSLMDELEREGFLSDVYK
jgi:ABC-type nitrate/sulfonate/bicarbonate transport system substrate-binding protein